MNNIELTDLELSYLCVLLEKVKDLYKDQKDQVDKKYSIKGIVRYEIGYKLSEDILLKLKRNDLQE